MYLPLTLELGWILEALKVANLQRFEKKHHFEEERIFRKFLYSRYSGGLTTPGCNEVVEWTVFEKAIAISSTQASFTDSTGIKKNDQVMKIQRFAIAKIP